MARFSFLACSLFCFFLYLTSSAVAHGTMGSMGTGQGLLVSAEYDDGEPMSYTAITVYHDSEDMPFQAGRTDRNGRFMIFPEGPGTYKAVVRDEMGHALTLETRIDETGSTSAPEKRSALPKTIGAITGLNMIVFLSSLGLWIFGKRRNNRSLES